MNDVFWFDASDAPSFPALAEDLSLDVAVVGGGIVGLTTAQLLRDAGLKVAVFEARRIGRQATGRSTAKVTSQHGLKYTSLISSFGRERAAAYAAANERAVHDIAERCRTMPDEAGLAPRHAYVYSPSASETRQLEKELDAAQSLGLPADMVEHASFPAPAHRYLRFRDQYQFDPYGYLSGLAAGLAPQVAVYEASRATEIESGEPCRLTVNGRQVAAGHVIVATQIPVVNEGMYFAKAHPFAHPVVAAPLPEGVLLEGMFISAGSPSHSLRTAELGGRTYLMAAGGEYKTGEEAQAREAMAELMAFLAEHFGIHEASHAWTNEDFRAIDGAAFVGPASRSSERLLVATGFEAWGITQGTVAAEVLAARILGRPHPCAELFDSTRIKPLSGGPTFVTENLKAAAHLVGDRVLGRKTKALDAVPPGGGAVIAAKGEKLAIRKHADGRVTALSAVCTHMGCIVGWNPIDGTWDCPCHGSRFDEHGEVLVGPATTALGARVPPTEEDAG